MIAEELQILKEPPSAVPPDVWGALTDGQRLRWLRANQYQLQLSRAQFLELAQVPYWAAYGPEHGLPPELFNDRGFLLPKYRPGGGSHTLFQRWRKWYRRVGWHQHLLKRRVQRFYHRSGFLIVVPWYASGFVFGILLGRRLHGVWPHVPADLFKWGVIAAHWLISLALIFFVVRTVSRCISRRVLKSLPPPEGASSNPSLQRTRQ